jgi:hypothetical protein
MNGCPCDVPVSVNPVEDFEGSDFLKISNAEWATMLKDDPPATPAASAPEAPAAASTPPANETAEQKIKRKAKEA